MTPSVGSRMLRWEPGSPRSVRLRGGEASGSRLSHPPFCSGVEHQPAETRPVPQGPGRAPPQLPLSSPHSQPLQFLLMLPVHSATSSFTLGGWHPSSCEDGSDTVAWSQLQGGEPALWPHVCVLFAEYVSWKSWGSYPLAGRASGARLSPSIRLSSSPTRRI